MAVLNFPDNPTPGQVYEFGAQSWTWDGWTWNITVPSELEERVSDLEETDVQLYAAIAATNASLVPGEVFVGPLLPVGGDVELWYDTTGTNASVTVSDRGWAGFSFVASQAIANAAFTGLDITQIAGSDDFADLIYGTRPSVFPNGPTTYPFIRLKKSGYYTIEGEVAFAAAPSGFNTARTYAAIANANGSLPLTVGLVRGNMTWAGPIFHNSYGRFDIKVQVLSTPVTVFLGVYYTNATTVWTTPGQVSVWREA